MFQLLLKNSLRHLTRNKLFTFLNILGLTIGISSCWVIFKFVHHELSYENGLANKDKIFRIVSKLKFGQGQYNWNAGVSRPIFFALRDEVQSLQRAVPVYKSYTQSVVIPEYKGQPRRIEELDFENQVIETEDSYFEMIPYTWLAGNKNGALSGPNKVVLTEDRARFYFPNMKYEEIIGKTLIYSDSLQKTVTGVIAALDYPSEFKGEEFVQLQKTAKDNHLTQWTNTNSSDRIYIEAKDQKHAQNALSQINNIVKKKYDDYLREIKPEYKWSRNLELLPLKDSHYASYLNERQNDKTSKGVIYGLIAVSIFLLVLACINYINLTTAQIPQRAKEIGIRKTLGGSKKTLMVQMMTETAIIICIAVLASYFVSQIGFAILGNLISNSAKSFNSPLIFGLFIIVILFFTLVIAGLYPSWMITKVNAIDILTNKGNLSTGKTRFNLRKILIVFQFVIAQIFIVASLIIGQQLQYTIKKDLGFNKDAVVLVDIPYKLYNSENFHNRKKTLASEFKRLAGIKEITMGTPPLSIQVTSSAFPYSSSENSEPNIQQVFKKYVEANYLEFYDLKLLAGKNIPPSDTTNAYVINETASKIFGFKHPEDAIGKIIGQKGMDFPIVGVIQDFHARDFYTPIEPLALMSDGWNNSTYNIRIDQTSSKDFNTVLEDIKSKWSEFFPAEEFDYKFYDESILELYQREQQLQRITKISMSIAVLLSCLGLFGLATISAYQRTKEIGIRKVLGASISGIVGMLSKDFLKMVLIAILIASPIVWGLTNKWLEDFVYRIEISWLPFVLGGLIAIGAALITVSYQALKAAKVNPADSLRNE